MTYKQGILQDTKDKVIPFLFFYFFNEREQGPCFQGMYDILGDNLGNGLPVIYCGK